MRIWFLRRSWLAFEPLNIIDYESSAWPDSSPIKIAPFGDLPVFLSPGNHETIPPATRADYLAQFCGLARYSPFAPAKAQDDPRDHKLRAYYHWSRATWISSRSITPPRTSSTRAQMDWIRAAIKRDETSDQIRTIVVGMHEALPGSLGDLHSMSESGQGARTGREVYEALLHAQNSAHKRVYVFASHSHYSWKTCFVAHLERQGAAGLDCGHRGRGSLPATAASNPAPRP